jgi:succinyl-diaminopimelate desuccinylase
MRRSNHYLAAIIVAIEQLLQDGAKPSGRLGILLTSDEEEARFDGTEAAVNLLLRELEAYRYGLVAEPSADQRLGDRIKIGARGRLTLEVKVRGVGGHTGYSVTSRESIVIASRVIQRVVGLQFEDPAPWSYPDNTTPHVTNVHSGSGAKNAIDEVCTIDFEFRTLTAYPLAVMQALVDNALSDVLSDSDQEAGARLDLSWLEPARPWFSEPARLARVVDHAVSSTLGLIPARSISGGTGDARYLQGIVQELVELGPPTAANSIHAPNEKISLRYLDDLVRIYKLILAQLAF